MLVITTVLQIRTEEGIQAFGIVAIIFGVVFLAMGLQIARQEME